MPLVSWCRDSVGSTPMSGLPESVERILVEALAAQDRFARKTFGMYPKRELGRKEPDSGEVTREILNKVADELEEAKAILLPEDTYGWTDLVRPAKWLRSQIGE